uniref:DUF7918 domain-containing protein n=1 Tax=Psilocybe cubensis TaxID=181762 RepID=A0A8H7Y0Q6_PSICU
MFQLGTVLGNRAQLPTPPPPQWLEFKNLRAFVDVDGKPLSCHAVCVDRKARDVSCWIASEVPKRFTVNLMKEETPYPVRVDAILDGRPMKHRLARKHEVDMITFDSIRTSANTKRPFVFSPLELTDDEDPEFSSHNFNHIGEIKLEVHRVTHIKRHRRRITEPKSKNKPKPKKKKKNDDSDSDDYDCGCHAELTPSPESSEYDSEYDLEFEEDVETRENYPDVPEVEVVHEKSREAQTVPHQIAYGEDQYKPCYRDNSEWTTYRVYTDLKELVASFTFRYRPLDVLVSNCIVRQNPVPCVTPKITSPDKPAGTPLRPMREASVQVRVEENEEDINNALAGLSRPPVTPDLGLPITNQVGSFEEELKPGATLSYDDNDDDEICNAFDERIKTLMAKVEQLRAEKRKRREEIQGPKKRVKMEPETLVKLMK